MIHEEGLKNIRVRLVFLLLAVFHHFLSVAWCKACSSIQLELLTVQIHDEEWFVPISSFNLTKEKHELVLRGSEGTKSWRNPKDDDTRILLGRATENINGYELPPLVRPVRNIAGAISCIFSSRGFNQARHYRTAVVLTAFGIVAANQAQERMEMWTLHDDRPERKGDSPSNQIKAKSCIESMTAREDRRVPVEFGCRGLNRPLDSEVALVEILRE
ncbi:hypothetical protein B0H16DRAFT_1465253 [Mycena metata]|uniref:Uncharacterized protein n=1 Tax=Mycena metata TaxID=1033252 RepID=A0AAD7IBT0_9AGAR|nr:hypothetical protein B0H16DRAFT_1465253 [Mycena metata]